MKKIIASIILLALILGMIVSCNNVTEEIKETTTRLDEATEEEIKYKLPGL
ncbi:MAG: hypothetical protein FWF15_02205 [Oscillospiraceae bacterium]|nr:hypothetical protein [Oscillospiraceae bacterium]